jgi:hypothetical protein
MSRNFELMTQLGLQMGVTNQPKPEAADFDSASDVVQIPNVDAGDASEEQMTRFILEMFPRGGSGQKK